MAQLTQEQLKNLLDRGLTLSQVQQIAAKRGDTVPSPTLLGYIAKPFVGGALRAGQAVGAVAAQALGATPEQSQKAIEESRVLKAPLLGTLAFEGQKPFSSQRGTEQIVGQTLETAGTVFPVGRATTALKPFIGKTGALTTSLGATGYGIETGTKLQEGAPNAFTPGLGTAIPAGIPIVGKALSSIPSISNFAVAKSLGVTADDVKTILTRPNEFQTAQREGLNRVSLGNLVDEKFNQLTKANSETGALYSTLRQSSDQVVFKQNPVPKVLAKYGLSLEDGRLVLTPESPALSGGDVSALERFMSQFGFEDKLSANAFLNARRGLDDLSNWQRDPSRTDQLERIARELRREYDAAGKAQIKGLKDLDAKTAPIKNELKELRKEYFQFRDGNWELKDSALSKITNASNKGREKVLERLEKYVPGITQQIQLVKALEGITAANGPRAGQYVNAGLLLGGPAAAIATGNPFFALISLLASVPQIAVPILIAFGKINGIAKGVMQALVGKILTGKTLTEQELLIYKNAIINHLNQISPGDQFFSSPTGKRVTEYLGELNRNPRLGLQLEDVTRGGFKNFEDLSTKLLSKLEGRKTVSRQFIEDLTNQPDLKQPEKDLFRRLLADEGDEVSVPDFANRVKSELLPLTRKTLKNPRYESVGLSDELKSPTAKYQEHIYESPISTSAGGVHYPGESNNYVMHSRTRDLADGETRVVDEIQADLFQKGRLEGEVPSYLNPTDYLPKNLKDELQKVSKQILDIESPNNIRGTAPYKTELAELKARRDEILAQAKPAQDKAIADRTAEIGKLEPYRNTWHERIIREEVKQAALDGKTKLQFPTGETAMKIEGLGTENSWFRGIHEVTPRRDATPLKIDDLKIGEAVQNGNGDNWIITDVLGDGKFKAVPKQLSGTAENMNKFIEKGEFDKVENFKETFDISGKVDTENPIYKFYEKTVQKYLKNKYGGKVITDPQGVKWVEIDVPKEAKRLPVEAFGAGAIPLLNQENDE